MLQTITSLLWASQLTTILPLAHAFPIHFPPSSLTNSIPLSPTLLSLLADPTATLPWDPKDDLSPPTLLCTGPSLAGPCLLLDNNTPATCLNIDVEVQSLKISSKATCAVCDSPACTGKFTTFSSTTPDPLAPQQRIASLFCEAHDSFSTTDPSLVSESEVDQQPSGYDRQNRLGLRKKKRNTSPSHESEFEGEIESPPQAYPGAQAIGSPSLNPWKPPPDSFAGKHQEPSCGDGQVSANGQGCINPER